MKYGLSRASHSVSFAGKSALVFGLVLYAFLFAAMLMVRSDGTAPAVTHVATAMVDFSAELLSVSSEGAMLPVVVCWALVVFAVCFLIDWMFSSPQATSADPAAWSWAIGILVIFIGAVTFLIRAHQPRATVVDERALAVEFVRNNAEVMQAAGGNGEVSLLGYSQTQNEPAMYEVAVYGAQTLHVFVESSQSAAEPEFRLLCTTPLAYGDRDASKHPCEQK